MESYGTCNRVSVTKSKDLFYSNIFIIHHGTLIMKQRWVASAFKLFIHSADIHIFNTRNSNCKTWARCWSKYIQLRVKYLNFQRIYNVTTMFNLISFLNKFLFSGSNSINTKQFLIRKQILYPYCT